MATQVERMQNKITRSLKELVTTINENVSNKGSFKQKTSILGKKCIGAIGEETDALDFFSEVNQAITGSPLNANVFLVTTIESLLRDSGTMVIHDGPFSIFVSEESLTGGPNVVAEPTIRRKRKKPAETDEVEATEEEAPTIRRKRKKPAETDEVEATEEEAPKTRRKRKKPAETDEEEAPKTRRKRKKPAETDEVEATEEESGEDFDLNDFDTEFTA